MSLWTIVAAASFSCLVHDITGTSSVSWNPRVSCIPLVVQISDITANKTGHSSFINSPFTPGTTTNVTDGEARRWLTPGSTPPGWVSPGPSCTVTNSKGTTSLFVQINGVERAFAEDEDYSNSYDPVNGGSNYTGNAVLPDTTFNLFDPLQVPDYGSSCVSASDPSCYGRIHTEIDHDWKAAGYCGTGTFCDTGLLRDQSIDEVTKIDAQGFIFWDPDHVGDAWHSFSGWEIHPLTAWKPSGTSPPSSPYQVNVTRNPVYPGIGQLTSFTTTGSGTTFTTYKWDFGDGSNLTTGFTSVSHMYTVAGAYSVTVTATDVSGNTASRQNLVHVGPLNPAVRCQPVQTTIENLIGAVSIQRIPLNPSSVGADYSGGGFLLDGSLPYGSNPSSWPFYKRDLQISCNFNDIGAFVEIDNVTVTNLSVGGPGECKTSYFADNGGGPYPNGWQSCDISFTLAAPGYSSATTCHACYMHRVYSVIDANWNASGVAPMTHPVNGQQVDVQGWVFWNPDSINQTFHSYSGWEIHPLTGWRLSRPSVSVSATVSPASTTPRSSVSFQAVASGGTGPYSYSWDFGDGTGSTGSSSSILHSYATVGVYKVGVSAVDANGTVGVYTVTVTVSYSGGALGRAGPKPYPL